MEGDWEVSQLQATSKNPFEDSGTGQEMSIRVFKGRFPIIPLVPPEPLELWEVHEKMVRHSIWKDGWEQVDDPRVVIQEQEFSIFVPCKPKAGNTLLEKPKTLQEYATTGGSK